MRGGPVHHTTIIPAALSLSLLRGTCISSPTIFQNHWFCTRISNFFQSPIFSIARKERKKQINVFPMAFRRKAYTTLRYCPHDYRTGPGHALSGIAPHLSMSLCLSRKRERWGRGEPWELATLQSGARHPLSPVIRLGLRNPRKKCACNLPLE